MIERLVDREVEQLPECEAQAKRLWRMKIHWRLKMDKLGFNGGG